MNGMKRLLTALLVVILAVAATAAIIVLNPTGDVSLSLPNAGPEVIEVEYPTIANPNHQDFVGGGATIGRIFIGDSRFVGMDNAVHLMDEPDQFLVAKTSQGYNWFVNTALGEINDIRVTYADDFEQWQYIICLGINDLRNIDNYMAKYYELAQDGTVEIVLVSVNPVSSPSAISNGDVEAFNAKLQDSPFHYIDTYTVLQTEGFYAGDGVHYDDATYERIYNTILENL